GVFVPKATPPAVSRLLRDALRQAVADPEFKGAMAKLETPIHYLDAEEFQRFWDRDAHALAEGVRRGGRVGWRGDRGDRVLRCEAIERLAPKGDPVGDPEGGAARAPRAP